MSIWGDLRFSLRQLRKTPGFTITVLATLALCIGANTAIYSVIDTVLVRPLPYPEPERLGSLARHLTGPGGEDFAFAVDGAMWEAVHRNAHTIDTAVEGGVSGVNLVTGNRVEYIQQQRVSANYFHVLGVSPGLGREFDVAEDSPGGLSVTVLSYELWQRDFGGTLEIVGRTIDLKGEPFTVVGVMPKSFLNREKADLWTPLRPKTTGEGGGTNYRVLARLKPGVSWSEARTEVSTLEQPVLKAMLSREGAPPTVKAEMQLVSLQQALTDEVRSSVLPKWGAVILILLIGCVNVAGLLIANSASRRREIATRLALGASRSRILTQLLTESALLAFGGAIIGLGIASVALQGLKRLGMEGLDLWRPVTLDARILAATFVIAFVTSILFGLVPALESSRLDIRSVLLEGGRASTGGHSRIRQVLVISEIALGLVLTTSAGLLVRTLSHLRGLDPGFDPHRLVVAQLSLQDARYATSASVNALFNRSLERIRALPGVESAAVALSLPYQRPLNSGVAILDGPGKRTGQVGIELIFVTPGFFDTLRIPIKGGRVFSDRDGANSQPVAVVNEAFVGKFLRSGYPLGTHLEGLQDKPSEIIGVVRDTPQHSGLGNFGPLAATPSVYIPAAQASDQGLPMIYTWFSPNWVVRTHGNQGALMNQMRAAIQSIDPRLPFSAFKKMEELQDHSVAQQRYEAILFTLFAGLALMLTAVGISGLIANSVTQRTREIGIRMALGASLRNAVSSIVIPGINLAGIGIGAGLALAWFANRLIQDLIWGVAPHDPQTYVVAIGVIAVVSCLASLLPALRLTRLDPAQTLRDQ